VAATVRHPRQRHRPRRRVPGGPKTKAALKEAIASGKLALSKSLVTLDTRVPLKLDWEGWKRRDWNGQRLLELFQEYGFRGFAERVRKTLTASGARKNAEVLEAAGLAGADLGSGGRPAAGTAVTPAASRPPLAKKRKPGAPSLFDTIMEDDAAEEPAAPATDDWKYTGYKLIDTDKAFTAFLKDLKKQRRVTFDLETTGLDPLQSDIVGYAFAWKPEEAYYVAVRGPKEDKTLDPDKVLKALKPVFEDPKVAKTNLNIKYDLLVLRAAGVELAGVAGDPMVAHYLLHAGERSHGLDELTRTYLGHENISITELIGKGKKQITMAEVRTEKVRDYAGEDADAAWRLDTILEPDLEKEGLRKLYDEVEIPLIGVLAELEFNGVRLDVPFLQKLGKEMETQLAGIEKEAVALAGKEFNLGSPKQLAEVLFDEMKLPVQKRTDTTGKPSTDAESLEKLAALGHPLPRKIVEHRQIAKLKGTYVDALPALVNPRTGRVHTSFNQTVASTGRLSSSDPNLQNIPARTDQGRQIRQAFLPPDGWQLLTADYSQVELRLLAHFSGDEALRTAFAEDRDIHASVAAGIFKVPEDQVTSAQRRVAKTVNFGVIYGMSGSGLAVRLGISKAEADRFIDEYFARFPKVLAYQQNLLAKCHESAVVGTLLGRRRKFDRESIRPKSSYQQRNTAEREAINMEIQGSAADLMKLAMLNVYRELKDGGFKAKMLLTVHDELVFEVPPKELKRVAALVRDGMAGAMTLDVPLKVDVAAGKNWLEVEDVG
jgi:DNA polymerase-1